MGLFKLFKGILGFSRDEDHHQHHQHQRQDDTDDDPASSAPPPLQNVPRKGFSVPVQVTVDRSPPTPLLRPCPAGDGGLQGLQWYTRQLKIDEDGDVADEFLVEVLPDASTSAEEHNRPLPRFEVNYSAKPAKVRHQALMPDGKIQHQVEHQGRLEWL